MQIRARRSRGPSVRDARGPRRAAGRSAGASAPDAILVGVPLTSPDAPRPYFTPSSRVAGDWSAHIATSLDRTAAMLEGLGPEQWDEPSLCEGWRVRDVAGHLIWRLGSSTWELLRTGAGSYFGRHVDPAAAVAEIGVREGSRPVEELARDLRSIAESKVRARQRVSIAELTEAVVHAYDMSEALGEELRLSPRSTAAVVMARLRAPGPGRTLARSYSLAATDARWELGRGPRIEATAAQITMHVFDRRRLALQPVEGAGDAAPEPEEG